MKKNNSLLLKLHQCRIKRNLNVVCRWRRWNLIVGFQKCSDSIEYFWYVFFYLHFHGLFDAFWCVGVWLWWAASHLFSFCSSYFRAVIKRAARIGRSVYILLRIGVPFSGQWERCQLWESSSYKNVFFYTFRAFYGYFFWSLYDFHELAIDVH